MNVLDAVAAMLITVGIVSFFFGILGAISSIRNNRYKNRRGG